MNGIIVVVTFYYHIIIIIIRRSSSSRISFSVVLLPSDKELVISKLTNSADYGSYCAVFLYNFNKIYVWCQNTMQRSEVPQDPRGLGGAHSANWTPATAKYDLVIYFYFDAFFASILSLAKSCPPAKNNQFSILSFFILFLPFLVLYTSAIVCDLEVSSNGDSKILSVCHEFAPSRWY